MNMNVLRWKPLQLQTVTKKVNDCDFGQKVLPGNMYLRIKRDCKVLAVQPLCCVTAYPSRMYDTFENGVTTRMVSCLVCECRSCIPCSHAWKELT